MIKMLTASRQILENLQTRSGLFTASAGNVSTGYNKAWIRDNIYEAIGFETFNIGKALQAYHALFDIFLKHEYKIDWAIREKPKHAYQYIHARYNPETFEEFWEEWGNKQNDAIGLFLFKVGELAGKRYPVIRNEDDLRILQKLVDYLASVEYWHDRDNGIWEENEEVHASSVGACAAGLKMVSASVKSVNVDKKAIESGEKALACLLPNESETKDADLALLSLIYPFNIATEEQRDAILADVEEKLLRNRGVIRYIGDKYYNAPEKIGSEAEWCFGLPWLAIIYKQF